MTDTHTDESLGRRARNRLATRRKLEDAAAAITLEQGPSAATIEAITAAAGVSPRTFHNYFSSREDAILGLGDLEIDARSIEAHLAAARQLPIVGAVVRLLVTVCEPALADRTRQRLRLRLRLRSLILQQHPELLGHLSTWRADGQSMLEDAVHRILGERSARPVPRGDASVVLAACGAALRAHLTEREDAGEGTALDGTTLERLVLDSLTRAAATLLPGAGSAEQV